MVKPVRNHKKKDKVATTAMGKSKEGNNVHAEKDNSSSNDMTGTSPLKEGKLDNKNSKKRKITLLSDEVDFVRGKKNFQASSKAEKVEPDNLFKEVQKDNAENPKVKKPKDDTELGKPLDELTYKKLLPGMLVMGVVSEVGEVDIVLNLPNGLTGFIKGTEISEEFNKTLDNSSDDGEADEADQELDICEIVSIGQYLVCSVIDIVSVDKTRKVNLTTRPEVVNRCVKSQDINKNMVFQGVVQSEEDYGYMINLGVAGTTAFLNKVAEERVLKKCDVVRVVVRSVNDGNVILGLYEAKSKPLSEKAITTWSSLLPGHLVNVAVKRQSVNGVRCSFLGGMQGAIHMVHLRDMYSSKSVQEVYPVKRKLTTRVILINPNNKTVLLSTLDCHVALETPCYALQKGDVVEDVEVVKVTKQGVYIALDPGVTGFAHKSKLQDKDVEKIGANFKAGTKHKARVMGFRLADNLVQLSLRPSDISKPFLSYHDIKVCGVVVATILTVEDFGLVVKLADNIRGFVPRIHLSDIKIKNPALKFKQNQKVKAKVLTVDASKRRITLTLKRSIIRNSTANVTSYEALEKNQQVTGWIASIKQFGIIMNFTSKLRGLVHSSDISNVPITEADIGKLYRLGQVLSCRVVHVNPEKEKLSLSLNLLEELEAKDKDSSSRWARRGQIYSCTVLTNKPDGLTVQLNSTKEEAFLPTCHLSDHLTLNQTKLLHLKAGSKIDQVLVINKKLKKITVSAKSSLINWVKSYQELPKISDFSIGDFVPGYIKDFQDYGCFIEIGNGLVGLCPKACLSDGFVSNPKSVYNLGDTVMCKITNIDTEKERFLVSLKNADVGKEESMSGPNMLDSLFKEFDGFGDIEHEAPGTVVQCEIVRIVQGYSVKVGEHAGYVAPEDADNDIEVGDSRKGVVLDFDPSQTLYVLNLCSEFVKTIEKMSKKKKLTKGAELTGKIVCKRDEYFVVIVPEHGYRIGYVHLRQHISDSQGSTFKDIKCGDEQKVVVSRAKKGKPLLLSFTRAAPDTTTSQQERKRKRSEEQDVKFDDIKLGECYTVTVKSVKSLQLNVQLGRKVNGRVHITEVTDTPECGGNPLDRYKHGDTLQVKLIGFRHSKTHRYLPITRTDYVKSMGEFSLRDSVIKSPKIREIKEDEKVDETKDLISTLVVGQQITGFVRSVDSNGFVWICLTPGVEARLWHTLTSLDKEEIGRWMERFTVGQCVRATVFSTRDNRIDISLVGPLAVEGKLWCQVKGTLPGIGVKLQISARDWGIAPLTELNDNYTKDPLSKYQDTEVLVQCVVVETPSETNKRIVLSLRKSRTSQRWKKAVGGRKVVNPVVNKGEDLAVGSVYSGYIKSTSATAGIYVALGYSLTGRVLLKNMSDNFLKNWEPMFPLGKLVKVYVMQTEPKVELSMKLSDLKKGKKKEEKEDEDGEEIVQRCLDDMLLEKYQNSDEEDDVVEETGGEADDSDEEVGEVEDAPKIVFASKKSEENANGVKGGICLSDVLLVDDKQYDEEEEETTTEKSEETEEKKGKSFLKREKKRRKEEAEEAIRKIEMQSKSPALETEDDFEREVTCKPDCSASWVSYMAYWLGLGNVEKARTTAKRALDTINYRLEEDKLNVWSALFNVENSFGTPDSLMTACREAAAVNDSKAVFTRLAVVLDKSNKVQELDDIYSSVLLKKYKRSRKVWCNYATSLATQDRLEDMRDLLTKALKSLPKHKHIRTISHFAQLEYKHGDPNRGSTMFENVLNTYPGRLDLWSVYLDKTIALGDHEQSRLLLDRVVGLKLPAKKMRFFFKRYIDFEKAHGDDYRLNAVREKAKLFLESNIEE